jgi:hypothetical protein
MDRRRRASRIGFSTAEAAVNLEGKSDKAQPTWKWMQGHRQRRLSAVRLVSCRCGDNRDWRRSAKGLR